MSLAEENALFWQNIVIDFYNKITGKPQRIKTEKEFKPKEHTFLDTYIYIIQQLIFPILNFINKALSRISYYMGKVPYLHDIFFFILSH